MTNTNTFIKAYHYVLSDFSLSSIDKLVYCTLLSYQESGLDVFPSNAHIAKTLGISERSVKNSTKELESRGLIGKQRRFNKSNLVTVKPFVSGQANCAPQTGKTCTSGQANCAPLDVHNVPTIRLDEKTKENISLEEKVKSITESKNDFDKSFLVEDDSVKECLKEQNDDNDTVTEEETVMSNRQVPVEPFTFPRTNAVTKLKKQPEPVFDGYDDEDFELPYDEDF